MAGASTKKKACEECGTFLQGRIDKRFCSDYCRAGFHNKKKGQESPVLREITAILKKNRSILQQFIACGNRTISKAKLLIRGFVFHFNTHRIDQSDCNPLFFCFDYGYQKLDEDEIRLFHNTDIELDDPSLGISG